MRSQLMRKGTLWLCHLLLSKSHQCLIDCVSWWQQCSCELRGVMCCLHLGLFTKRPVDCCHSVNFLSVGGGAKGFGECLQTTWLFCYIFFFKRFLVFHVSECFANVYVCVPCLWLVPEEVKFPGTGVTNGCEPCESKLKSPGRIASVLNHRVISFSTIVLSAEAIDYVLRGPRSSARV